MPLSDPAALSEPEPRRWARDSAIGAVLMRCPVCHRQEYVSEHRVVTRGEATRCRWCGANDPNAVLEPVRDDEAERAVDRLRNR